MLIITLFIIIIMKKTTITVAICFLALMSTAQNQEIKTEQLSEMTSKEASAELVKTVEGIEVFYVKSEKGANTMLEIQFKNTTDNPVSFHWSIERDNGLTYVSSELITIKSGKSFTLESALEMKGSHEFTSYPINITLK